MRANKNLICFVVLVIAAVLALWTLDAAAAGEREIRLVCKDQPAVTVTHGARWVVVVSGDCARPADEQPPASRPEASEQDVETLPTAEVYPGPEPYPGP